MRHRVKRPFEVLAESLRHLAKVMVENPQNYSVEDGRALDRALRSCKGISDIDRVWVGWSFFAEKHGWLTDKEMVFTGARYGYKR